MMMIPRKRNDFDLFDEMFGMDPFFERRDAKLMKTDIKEKGDKYLIDKKYINKKKALPAGQAEGSARGACAWRFLCRLPRKKSTPHIL